MYFLAGILISLPILGWGNTISPDSVYVLEAEHMRSKRTLSFFPAKQVSSKKIKVRTKDQRLIQEVGFRILDSTHLRVGKDTISLSEIESFTGNISPKSPKVRGFGRAILCIIFLGFLFAFLFIFGYLLFEGQDDSSVRETGISALGTAVFGTLYYGTSSRKSIHTGRGWKLRIRQVKKQ